MCVCVCVCVYVYVYIIHMYLYVSMSICAEPVVQPQVRLLVDEPKPVPADAWAHVGRNAG